jgi:hypothetical protein
MPMRDAIIAIRKFAHYKALKHGRYDDVDVNTIDPEFAWASYYNFAIGEALRELYSADSRYETPMDVLNRLHDTYDRFAHYQCKDAWSYTACACAIDDLIALLIS